jgi:hypothetical protein
MPEALSEMPEALSEMPEALKIDTYDHITYSYNH